MLFVKDKSFYRSFFRMMFVIALQNVIVYGVNLADNIMIGQYSENAMAGVNLANQIQFLLQMLVAGAAEGISVLASRSWGAKEIGPIRSLLAIGARVAILIPLILWAAAFFFPQACLGLFSNDAAVIAEGVDYLRIVSFSYICFGVSTVLLTLMRSVETVFLGFWISLSTLFVNIGLNYTLIGGHFGAPALGIRGAAIATLVARILEMLIALVYVFVFDKKIRLRPSYALRMDGVQFKNWFKIGTPVICSNAIWGIAMGTQTSILGHMGSEAIVASSVANTIFQIVVVFAQGSASSAAVLMGKTIGAGQKEKVRAYAVTMQLIFLVIGVCSGVMLFLLRDAIVGIYALSDQARLLSLQFIAVLSVTIVGTSYQMPCLTGIVRGGGDTKFVLKNDTIFMWLIVLPISSLTAFVFQGSPLLVFICLKSDQILKCFVAIVKVNRFKWIREFKNTSSIQEKT